MANQLKMAVVHAILTLQRLGWSQRQIAEKLGIHRETVARYVHAPPGDSKPATNPIPGCEGVGVAVENPIPGPESLCEPFRPVIETKLEQGLTGQRIYQDLVEGHGFTASYSSVRRFLQRLDQGRPLPFRRLEVLPGEEAQVDFGTGAPILRADGTRRRPHVFRVVLSFSRKAYSEVVYHQTTEEFLRCLENAFWHFGGVPQTLVIDNLKAAVPQADWYDPEVHPKIQSFCQHYGTVILPTKPRTPRHKGKVERGIGYVQSNALKGRTFGSLAEQNQHLLDWEARIADKRSGECLFEIVLRRYETKSTMMTSNRPLEDWGKLLGDVPAATAILDRFLHHAEIITITGRSYRLKDKAAKDPDKSKEQTKDEPDKDSK